MSGPQYPADNYTSSQRSQRGLFSPDSGDGDLARIRFLASATDELLDSADPDDALRRVIHLSVPALCDLACYLVPDWTTGVLRAAEFHMADAARSPQVQEFLNRYPPLIADANGVGAALRSGEAGALPETGDALRSVLAQDAEHLAALTAADVNAIMHVPLVVRDDVVGVFAFVRSGNREFSSGDVKMAVALSRRASAVVDRARLYLAEQEARQKAEASAARLLELAHVTVGVVRHPLLSDTLRALLEAVRGMLASDFASIMLVEDDADDPRLILRASVGLSEDARNQPVVPRGDGVAGLIAQTLEPLIVDNVHTHDPASPLIGEGVKSVVGVPLLSDGRLLGVINAGTHSAHRYTAEDRAMLELLAARASSAIARAHLYEAERRARGYAERLQRVTAALSESVTPDEVMDVVLEHTLDALDASTCTMALTSGDGGSVVITRVLGDSDLSPAVGSSFPLDAGFLLSDVVRERRAIWLRSGYAPAGTGNGAWAALPLEVEGRAVGVLTVSYAGPHDFSGGDSDFALSVARQAAQALERSRLFQAEQDARREAVEGRARAAFLADASALLASSLDYRDTLQALTRATVPVLANWCAVDMLDGLPDDVQPGARLRRLAEASVEQDECCPGCQGASGSQPPPEVLEEAMRTGRTATRMCSASGQVSGSDDGSAAGKGSRFAASGFDSDGASMMVVPVLYHGRAVGTISLCRTHSGRSYNEADRMLAEELARRTAVSLEQAWLYRAAQEANAAKAEFLSTISHELRTPLNAIIGYSDLLWDGISGPINEKQARQLERVRTSARHLLLLIDETLAFARSETNSDPLVLEEVDLRELAREAAEPFAIELAERGITFIQHVEDNVPKIFSDHSRIRQILRHLLSNAGKFTNRGSVTFSVSRDGDGAVVEVADTGIGIAPENLPRVFEPFWQVEQSRTRRVGGTGIGLSVARKYAEMLGGTLTVHSVPAEGSTFTLRLPRDMSSVA